MFVIWQASWYDKLLERLRNLRKRSNSKLSGADDGAAPAAKKSKRSSKLALLKRYPPRLHDDSIEDEDSVKQHKSAMASEMSKRKPREIVVLPLLRSTYSTRRDYITSDEREDVTEILEEYPALRLPAAVSFMSIKIRLEYIRGEDIFPERDRFCGV